MLESALKEQLKGIFAGLEANFTFDISVSSSHENKTELLELLGDVADSFFLPLSEIHPEDFGLDSIRRGLSLFLAQCR